MKILRAFAILASVVTLSACAEFVGENEVETLTKTQAVGSPFARHLADEYRSFSYHEHNEMSDYPDAIHFARKGLNVASGEQLLPEAIADWNLLPAHIRELSSSRERLLGAFQRGGREMAPQVAAVAQARFDCWIEQQEEHWDLEVPCKSQFYTALKRLEDVVGAAPVPAPEPAPAPAPVEPEPMQVEDAMYIVFFDFDSANIGQGGQSVLDAVAREAYKRQLNAIRIVGHTDRSGSSKYNDRLAKKRSQAVKDALVQRGVDPALVVMEHRGERELLVDTPDSVREPANRRANITFE